MAASLNSSLATVSLLEDLPSYASFAVVVDPGAPEAMREARNRAHGELHHNAAELAKEYGVQTRSSVLEGREVEAVLRYLREERADLLVLGLHQHDFYLSRLWSSVYDLANNAPCSVLGVH
jgi:nucleotide-binding universal stress UspA family protein